ncbi:HAD family hydrolase [Tautonia plasticadhaerens]|uniref:Haloacid dehalogenase-like hydrolase n=1 Tax=Tautonia plasticadhaerens TaxID=2527974 RepID=A0A518GUS6_9BACT|nr:HAD family hydrolase [Tautonia plasticadhaerens]QDV32339.1 haloacid dehalogenase-like hydrolase [Tautonia plasticadhaerens]
MSRILFALTLAIVAAASSPAAGREEPLPSWVDGPTKRAILEFVGRVSDEAGPGFVPVADRIAVFDNDGTLWCEQPVYVQAVFIRDRVRALAERHPGWRETPPYSAVLDGDRDALAALGEKGVAELVSATHAGMTVEEFRRIAEDWIALAEHPRFDRPYTGCVYQPMLELLGYLRSHGFKTFIVSGGGVEFMRPWTGPVYGIPPEQVVGSTIRTAYREVDGRAELVRLPEIDFIDDKAGKPVGIGRHIGRRPIAAFGNSDGDYEMLRYATEGPGPRLGLIVHHTDADREYAYDRDSPVGRLDRALDEAADRGWVVADMARDWARVFPPPSSADARPPGEAGVPATPTGPIRPEMP